MRILFLGAGSMTQGLIMGLKGHRDLSNVFIYSPSGKSAKDLSEKSGAQWISSLDDLENPDWVFVGCKPQQLNDLKETLKGRYKNALFISMLAAIPEKNQADILGVKRLVRIMPNLAVRYNQGVTLLCSESAAHDLKMVETFISSLGLAQIVSEKELEELTLLTGSGPAFFYEFALTLARSATSLSEKERENLVRMVLLGSGVSSSKSELSLPEMINKVTSRGGVTIAVLEEWRQLSLGELVKKGYEAGLKRAQDLKTLLTHQN